MADDIDIEEHDLLENPRIKDILPHFSIKSEPVDLDEEEYQDPSENYSQYEYYNQQDYEENETENTSYQDFNETSPEPYEQPSPPTLETSLSNEIYHHKNKIILGTKPCSKVQSPIIIGATSITKVTEVNSNVAGPIMLGSKPCPKSVKHRSVLSAKRTKSKQPLIVATHGSDSFASKPCPKSRKKDFEGTDRFPFLKALLGEESSTSMGVTCNPEVSTELNDTMTEDSDVFESEMHLDEKRRPDRVLKDAIVFLEDWSVRLDTSSCYCKECQTLFATRNALDAHNMAAHSFLVAMDSPGTPKTPEVQVPVEKTPENARYCNQCHRHFTDDNLLIQHLYEHLTAKNESVKKTAKVKDDVTKSGKLIVGESVKSGKMFYKCPVCFSYYVSFLRFKRHSLHFHKTTFENVEKVLFKNLCDLCDKQSTCDVRTINKHIQFAHRKEYEKIVVDNVKNSNMLPKQVKTMTKVGQIGKILPKTILHNKLQKTNPTKILKTRSRNPKFMCTKCKTVYSSIKSARAHVHRKHPAEKTIVQINRNQKDAISNNNQFQYYKTLIPKNVTYKCVKCNVHFVSAISVGCHVACAKVHVWKCSACNRSFNYRDSYLHKQQHEQSNNIKSITFSKNIYKKVLCKCSDCGVYFEEREFLKHRFNGCLGAENPEWCQVCKIKVEDLSIHSLNHEKKAKSEFLFVDDFFAPRRKNDTVGTVKTPSKSAKAAVVPNTEQTTLKRKLPLTETSAKKSKLTNKMTLYHCKLCNTITKYYKSRKFHASKYCLQQKNRVSYCTYCGLRFRIGQPIISHKEDHVKNKWKFKDIVFLNLEDGSPASPPIPKFPACKICKVQYLPAPHSCADPKKTCSICNENFSPSAFKLHKMHHKYLSTSDDVSVLIQKYESLQSTWNILYQCSECNLTTDSYDRAVEHSQNHFASAQKPPTKVCNVCCLHFEENAFKKHNELHENKSIAKSTFKILMFEYKDLLTDNWFELFKTVSKLEMIQITAPSIYATRSVKMSVILNGPPDFTIYKCESCKLYVDASNVFAHTHDCIGSSTSYACNTCGIPFSSPNGLKRHQKIHNNSRITANSYRIISFNAKADKIFNTALKENVSSELGEASNEFDNQSLSSVESKCKTKYSFFQCQSCKSCSMSKMFKWKHNCILKSESWSCPKCPFIGTVRIKSHHLHWHFMNKDAKINEISFRTFVGKCSKDGYKEPSRKQTVWYQCTRCEVLTDSKTGHKCDAGSVRKCGKCNYKFSSKCFLRHFDEHRKSKTRKIDLNTVPISPEDVEDDDKTKVATLYKCTCGLHFISDKSLEQHAKACSPDIVVSSEDCSQCGLKFPTNLLVSHLCSHHRSRASGKQKIVVKTLEETSKNPIEIKKELVVPKRETKGTCVFENSEYDNVLYKCWCGLSFLTSGSAYDHAYDNKNKDHMRVKRSNCHKCGFTFSIKSLRRHLTIHHEIMGLTGSSDFVVKMKDGVACKETGYSKTDKKRIYKCSKCDVHFFASVMAKKHFDQCPNLIEATKDCKTCGLKFSQRAVDKHRREHHKKQQCSLEDLHVIDVRKSEIEDSKIKTEIVSELDTTVERGLSENVNNQKLYKCSVCGIHYLNMASLNKHDHDEDKVDCVACGLVFTPDNLVEHAMLHHDEMNLKPEDFKVVVSGTQLEPASDIDDTLNSVVNEEFDLEVASTSKIVKPSERTVVILKCHKCNVNFLSFSNVKKHIHKTGKHKLTNALPCGQCGGRFPEKSLSRHIGLHHEQKLPMVIVLIQEYEQLATTEDNLASSNVLYKCNICSAHFLSLDLFVTHVAKGVHDSSSWFKCEDCGLYFGTKALSRHVAVHHGQRGMRLEDFDIQTIESLNVIQTGSNARLTDAKTSCNDICLCKDAVESSEPEIEGAAQILTDKEEITADIDECEKSDVNKANVSVLNETIIVDKDSDESAVSQSSDLDVTIENVNTNIKNDVVKIYKCGACNVFFMNQSTCYKHTLNHIAMDPKEYIECKICSLQFKIMSLAQHIKKHHCKNFELSEVLVEEYQPKRKGQKTPKIDIYYAIDKVQSRLVSTTTDDDKVDAKITSDVNQSHIEEPTDEVTSHSDVLERGNTKSLSVKDINTSTSNLDPNILDLEHTNSNPAISELGDETTHNSVVNNKNITLTNNIDSKDETNLELLSIRNSPAMCSDLEEDGNIPDVALKKDSNIVSEDTMRHTSKDSLNKVIEDTPLFKTATN